jgi:hypothetical protein
VQREALKAVHDDDLEVVLKALGLYAAFSQGKLKCIFCSEPITWENLHSLIPDSGAIKCGCNKPFCVEQLVSRLEKVPA